MIKKKYIMVFFALMVLLQLAIPLSMITSRENLLNNGKTFKFITAPVDPNDPFRGKYITLNYKDNSLVVANDEDWLYGRDVYITVVKDTHGYARIQSISKGIPEDTSDYFEAKIQNSYPYKDSTKVSLGFPFDRFYMEESKAPKAEELYRKYVRNNIGKVYALVIIQKGEAILKNVFINDIPIADQLVD